MFVAGQAAAEPHAIQLRRAQGEVGVQRMARELRTSGSVRVWIVWTVASTVVRVRCNVTPVARRGGCCCRAAVGVSVRRDRLSVNPGGSSDHAYVLHTSVGALRPG